jgi:hypothetical protein
LLRDSGRQACDKRGTPWLIPPMISQLLTNPQSERITALMEMPGAVRAASQTLNITATL